MPGGVKTFETSLPSESNRQISLRDRLEPGLTSPILWRMVVLDLGFTGEETGLEM